MRFLNFFLAFSLSAGAALAQNPKVVSSINPIHQIVLAITEDKINSVVIIDPTISEHDFTMKKSDVAMISKAALVFYVDGNLEHPFARILKNPEISKKTFKLSQINGLKLLQVRGHEKELDPHLWLNPENAVKIAEFVAQKLSEVDAEDAKKYQKNLEKFKKETEKTSAKIRAQLAKINDSGFVFYHDGYQYFEDFFGVKPLKIVSHNHDHELSVKDVRALDKLVKEGKVKCIFGEPQDERNSAMKLAQKYQIKFSTLDLIGGKDVDYQELLQNLADDLDGCVN